MSNGICGHSRALRFISLNPGHAANVMTASHNSPASSGAGTREITGPKNAGPSSASATIGVPTSGPVRRSASSVSARMASSCDSSWRCSTNDSGRPHEASADLVAASSS